MKKSIELQKYQVPPQDVIDPIIQICDCSKFEKWIKDNAVKNLSLHVDYEGVFRVHPKSAVIALQSVVRAAPSLRSLNLDGNAFQGEILVSVINEIAKLTDLQVLKFSSNDLQNNAPKVTKMIAKLPKLAFLEFTENNLGKFAKETFVNLANSNSLEFLILRNNSLSEKDAIECARSLVNLPLLYAMIFIEPGCTLNTHDQIKKIFSNPCAKLIKLVLDDTFITNVLPKEQQFNNLLNYFLFSPEVNKGELISSLKLKSLKVILKNPDLYQNAIRTLPIEMRWPIAFKALNLTVERALELKPCGILKQYYQTPESVSEPLSLKKRMSKK